MLPKILADESVDFRIVKKLMQSGFNVVSVLKEYQGITDREVLSLAKKFKAVILTEDSDFGELIFAYKEQNVGVIFLRYKSDDYETISVSLTKILKEYGDSLYGRFVVITTKKIRIRELP